MSDLRTTGAAGVILFLIWDILGWAVEPVEDSILAVSSGEGTTTDLVVNLSALGLSIAFGLLWLVWSAGRVRRRHIDGLTAHDIVVLAGEEGFEPSVS